MPSIGLRLVYVCSIAVAIPAAVRGDTFTVVAVDTAGNVGEYASLALDQAGNPHISYRAGIPQLDLRYATRTETGWQIESLDPASRAGNGTSIAVDAQGKPRIAFRDDGADLLRYAEKDAGGWIFEPVGPEAIEFISLRLGDDGTPHIGYLDRNLHLSYATRRSTTWTVEWVDSLVLIGWPSLRLDPSGRPCMAASGGIIKYLCRSESGWSSEELTGSEGSSLAYDPDGNPHITYIAAEGVVYASRSAGGWSTELVTTRHGRTGTTLAIDSDGRPHLAWVLGEDLVYAVKIGQTWVVDPIEPVGLVGLEGRGTPSLALGADGSVHIAYRSETTGDLKYATTAKVSVQPATLTGVKQRYR